MIRCKAQSTGVVPRLRHAILKSALLCGFLTATVAGCVSTSPEHIEVVDIHSVVANPGAFDGKLLRTEVCVSVAVEGMYFLECGTRRPVIAFTVVENKKSMRAFESLVAFGHTLMGEAPEQIRVEVEGVYRHTKGQSRFDHTLELMSFKEAM